MCVLLSVLLSLSCMGPVDDGLLKMFKEPEDPSAASSSGLNGPTAGSTHGAAHSSSEGRPFLKVVDPSFGWLGTGGGSENHVVVGEFHLEVTPDSLKSFGLLSEKDLVEKGFVIISKENNPEMNALIIGELVRSDDSLYEDFPDKNNFRGYVEEHFPSWCSEGVMEKPESSITFILYSCREKVESKPCREERERRDKGGIRVTRPLQKLHSWRAKLRDSV